MNEWALEYITNGHRTYEGCVEKWNKDHPDKAIKLSSGKNKINYIVKIILTKTFFIIMEIIVQEE